MATGNFDFTTQNNNHINQIYSNSRIEQQNPHNESRKLPHGMEIVNSTIFRHLDDVTWSKTKLEAAIPNPPDGRFLIGELYGEEISIDHNGRFQFGNENVALGEAVVTVAEKIEEGDMVVLEEPTCDHGFVVRDIVGDNRFLCRECDERFPRHPSMIPKKVVRATPSFNIANSLHQRNILSNFRDGMITLTDAITLTSLSLEGLREAMDKAFPPEAITDTIQMIGDPHPKVIKISEGPKRVSSYQEVEDIFGNSNVNLDDFNKVLTSRVFSDLTHIDQQEDVRTQQLILLLNFVDGSVQRVELDEKDAVFRMGSFKSQLGNK